MNVDQDIQLLKMRHLPDWVYWTYLFKSIKNNRNKNTNEIDWINSHPKNNITEDWTYKKNYLKINIFYFEK